jgi:superfamily II DNA/RNA helicase
VTTSETNGQRPSLIDRIPAGGTSDPDEILDLFLSWVADLGFELYAAQEEALLEVMAGRHVILQTPTGSGKSLVALGLQFKGLCEGRRSYYTSPIKALASEKFFALCHDLGAESVGMLTGDASINHDALVVCCTAEVLSNMALRQGEAVDAPYVVMDEFHYYGDRDRGVAWQVPLITLPSTQFLLMSATLGDTSRVERHLSERTGGDVAVVLSDERPVPLDFAYRETPIHETVQDLLDEGRSPIYIVSFTQRECPELAQALTSLKLVDSDAKKRLAKAASEAKLDTPYGRELRRFLGFGVGVHHAGLLPKYRLLVEQLAQEGLLQVICGTDTLGVGVNIPIRTVLFSKLAKYDGRKTSILKVRDFQQIAGRAGRKGFDEAGSVVAQAPEHVVEAKIAERKADASSARKAKKGKRKPPPGTPSWTDETFRRLVESPPEMLRSRFKITHGMILDLIQRDAEVDDPETRSFDSLRELIARSHETEAVQERLISQAAVMVRALHRAGILTLQRDVSTRYLRVVVNENLQWDFSLYESLSLYLVETLVLLDSSSPEYALDVLSLVESVLEDPFLILRRQEDRIKNELLAELKAEGATYEERVARLDEVTYPKPNADFIYGTFERFRTVHPWVGGNDIKPKGIGRELYVGYMSFHDFIKRYGLQRTEGVLLRYLSQLYKHLVQSVPRWARTEEVYDLQGFFRTMLERVDTSLLDEWERLRHPEWQLEAGADEPTAAEAQLEELLDDPAALHARVRSELLQLVRALAEKDWTEAVACVTSDPEDPEGPWTEERFAAAMEPFFDTYSELVFSHEARRKRFTQLRGAGPRQWRVAQVLVDPEGDNLWHVAGRVDLRNPSALEGPLVILEQIVP